MRARATTAVALLVALLAGCGAPSSSGVHEIADEDVPFGLLDEQRQALTEPSPDQVLVAVFLVAEGDVLFPALRSVDDDSLASVLEQLERSLDATETAAGLTNPLAERDAVLGVQVDGGLVTIDLSEEIGELGTSDQLLAIAQLVRTATSRTGVTGVAFTLDGRAIEVPTADGSLTSEPVTAEDYARFSPR